MIEGVPPVFSLAKFELDRCIEAAGDGYHPQMGALIGTFSFWAIAVEDGLRGKHGGAAYYGWRRGHPADAVMPGVRLVRNAVAHGQLICAQSSGLTYPITYPMDFGPWIWQSLDRILADWTPTESAYLPAQKASYRDEVEPRAIVDVLRIVREWVGEFHP